MTDIVGSVLPALIPNVLINKREELLPLLVAAIVQQSNVEVQRTLVGHLLHLIKRPDLKQRHAICDACLSTIDHSHSVDLIESIIHHCAELASHKFSERRVLAAELCGQLVPYVEGTSTAVQVLAVLASLAGEAHPEVRFVVVKNLCVLVGHVELNAPFVDNEDGERNAMGHSSDVVIKTKSDGQETVYRKVVAWKWRLPKRHHITITDLHTQIRSLTLDFLCDDNVDVARVAQDILLPVLLDHLRKNPLVAENANVTAAEVGLYGFAQSVLNRLSILTQPVSCG